MGEGEEECSELRDDEFAYSDDESDEVWMLARARSSFWGFVVVAFVIFGRGGIPDVQHCVISQRADTDGPDADEIEEFDHDKVRQPRLFGLVCVYVFFRRECSFLLSQNLGLPMSNGTVADRAQLRWKDGMAERAAKLFQKKVSLMEVGLVRHLVSLPARVWATRLVELVGVADCWRSLAAGVWQANL